MCGYSYSVVSVRLSVKHGMATNGKWRIRGELDDLAVVLRHFAISDVRSVGGACLRMWNTGREVEQIKVIPGRAADMCKTPEGTSLPLCVFSRTFSPFLQILLLMPSYPLVKMTSNDRDSWRRFWFICSLKTSQKFQTIRKLFVSKANLVIYLVINRMTQSNSEDNQDEYLNIMMLLWVLTTTNHNFLCLFCAVSIFQNLFRKHFS